MLCCSTLPWSCPLDNLQTMPLQSHILGFILISVTWSPAVAFWPGVFPKQQRRCLPNSTVSYYHVHRRAAPRRFCVGAITSTVTEMVRRDLPNTFSEDTRGDFTEHATWGVIEDAREGCTGTRGSLHTTVPRRRFMHLASLILAAAATRLAVEPERVAAEETANNSRSPGDETQVVPGGSAGGAKYTVGSDEVGMLFGDGPIGVKLGANPLKASGICRVYVTEVVRASQATRQANLKAGFGVAAVAGTPTEKLEPKEVAELIRVSPRPLEIVFRDPELLARRLQAEADRKAEAAKLKRRQAADDRATTTGRGSNGSSGELRVTQAGEKPGACGIKTKAGDLIEFRYSGRLASDLSVEFDSSDRRGTGLPYAIVLGNGDVLKGLDLSLFDMCIGERRKIEIPARLAYGAKGSKIFGVPPDDGKGAGDVVYGVELVSINFNVNPSDKRDNFYTDDACDAAAFAAGNASGKCPT